MSCCHPFKAFRTGYKTDNGKDDFLLVFNDDLVDRISLDKVNKPVNLSKVPYEVIQGHVFLTEPMDVPCGCCIGCRRDKAREWKIRNCLELQDSPEAYYLTLTYDDWHLPKSVDGELVLNKKDVQLFLKRLRKYSGSQYRYFYCGEYGEHTKRPHYHMILYGHLEGFKLIGVKKWQVPILDDAWKCGNVLVEPVEPGSIAYVCGYVEKKWKDDLSSYKVKPFIGASKRPAIGYKYFEKRRSFFEDDMHVYGVFHNGKKSAPAPLPKLFKRKLQDETWYESWKEQAIKAGKAKQETLEVVYHVSTVDGLHDQIEKAVNQAADKTRKEIL